jgi:hypothetical protein
VIWIQIKGKNTFEKRTGSGDDEEEEMSQHKS